MEGKSFLDILGAIIVIGSLLVVLSALMRLRGEVRAVKILLRKIAHKVGIPEPGEDDLLRSFLAAGKTIEAIKRYREITGEGLEDAQDYIDSLAKK